MKKFFIFLLVGIIVSCSSDQKSEITVKETIIENANRSETVAEISLEGMSCVHMCGGMIKKNLMAMKGVQEVEFDFQDDRAIDVAKVKINSDVSIESLFETIQNLNDGQFSVKSCEVIRMTEQGEEDQRLGSLPLKIPNIFEVLSIVLKR